MIIENNTNTSPTGKNCSIQTNEKFYQKITDELKALQTELFEVKKKVDARDEVIDTLDLNTQSLSVGESTETKNLYVNQDASIQGILNANEATINTLNVVNDFITKLLHVTDLFANTADIEEADIRSAIIDILKIKQALQRFDTNQDVISFPSEHVTQIGDIANSILIAGLERPTWNGDPIALTSDLSTGLTPNYKGMLETEDELPPTATVGDFYLIKNVVRKTEHGLGSAIYGISEAWEVQLYYELLNYLNKDEINQLFDEELTDDIQRETDIIKGNTPVQVVANGCVMKRDDGTSDRLATAVDAFMLSGPEGMDNIATGSSLDDLVICGQYSADDDLANTITEKPTNEVGAFDIAVGQFSGSKQDIYQLYTGKASQKNYFRIGINKEFNNWLEFAYINGETPVDVANRLITGTLDSFNLPNSYGNKVVSYSGSAVDSPTPSSNGQAMTFSKGGSEQSIIAFDNTKNDMYFKTQFGDWKTWKKVANLDENGYVEKALTANNLNANAKIGKINVATSSQRHLDNVKAGWYKLCQMGNNVHGDALVVNIATGFYGTNARGVTLVLTSSLYHRLNILQSSSGDVTQVIDKIGIDIYEAEGTCNLYVSLKKNVETLSVNITGLQKDFVLYDEIEQVPSSKIARSFDLSTSALSINGKELATTQRITDDFSMYAIGAAKLDITPHDFFTRLRNSKRYYSGQTVSVSYANANLGYIAGHEINAGTLYIGNLTDYSYRANNALYLDKFGNVFEIFARYEGGIEPTSQYMKELAFYSAKTLSTYNQGITKEI